ncbi:unnamed protein product, partial [Symbiodinium sp. CCMP2456]
MGHGPAATGWPTWAASRWHERIHKASTNLKLEQIKRIAELQKHHEKLIAQGEKVRKEREHLAEAAAKRMSKGQELSELQRKAYELVHEGGPILESELPDEYHKEIHRIKLYE